MGVHLTHYEGCEVEHSANAVDREVLTETPIDVSEDTIFILSVVKLNDTILILDVELLPPEDLWDAATGNDSGPYHNVGSGEVVTHPLSVHHFIRDADVQYPSVLIIQLLESQILK